MTEVLKGQTFSTLSSLISNRPKTTGGQKLGDVIQLARTGKTPPRSSYTKEGLFLVKVGNLTGNGINWLPRERNFIKLSEEGIKRALSTGLILQEGDILLTSSAHSPVYIAKKVDVVSSVPEWVGGKASFVGEVMLLRPNKELINPFMLLAYLRSPKIVEEIQSMVRGQTAHLHPDDLLGLHIPSSLLDGTTNSEPIVENLKREAMLNEELNRVIYEQQKLLSEL
jgi:type I restriction enzyme M protein